MPNIWPQGLIQDEVWLKSRRTLVQALVNEGLWINDMEYRNFMNQEGKLGHELKNNLLKKILYEDFSLLNSGGIFGNQNRKFVNRLPFCLSFGYSFGYNLACIYGYEEQTKKQAAELSSLFNLGISIIDLIVDNDFSDTEIKIWMPFDNIQQYIEGRKTNINNLNFECIEHRLAIKIVIGFFNLLAAHLKHDIYKSISKRLITLYTAEESSLNHSWDKNAYFLSFTKSAGPFIFIDFLISSFNNSHPNNLNEIRKLRNNLGKSYWLLDDLVDLIEDYQNGSLNSVLIKANLSIKQKKPKYSLNLKKEQDSDCYLNNESYSILLDEILRKNIIESECKKLLRCIKKSLDIIKSNSLSKYDEERFSKFFLTYIRDWLS